jgi:hypothetical protein
MFQRCRVANMARTRIEKCDCVIATEQDGDGTEIELEHVCVIAFVRGCN